MILLTPVFIVCIPFEPRGRRGVSFTFHNCFFYLKQSLFLLFKIDSTCWGSTFFSAKLETETVSVSNVIPEGPEITFVHMIKTLLKKIAVLVAVAQTSLLVAKLLGPKK